jgi:fucose permease
VMLQHLSEDKMRGRVMSIYAMAFLGFLPLGSLVAGWLAGRFTAPATIAAMALVAIVLHCAIGHRRSKRAALVERASRAANVAGAK